MSRHDCPGEDCPRCQRAIADIEDARNGADFDPSGREADAAAGRYEDWLMGDR